MFVVEESTTPLGEVAYRFIYFGLTAAVFAAAAAAATPAAIGDAVAGVLAVELADGGDIDVAIDTAVGAAVTTHAALETGVHGLE